MERASAAMQQKRKSNNFLICMLPRLVGLIWKKLIRFFDRSPRVPVNFHRSVLHPLECFRLPPVLPTGERSAYNKLRDFS